jgi:hypothetical protein
MALIGSFGDTEDVEDADWAKAGDTRAQQMTAMHGDFIWQFYRST